MTIFMHPHTLYMWHSRHAAYITPAASKTQPIEKGIMIQQSIIDHYSG